jgi:hypothetical protein
MLNKLTKVSDPEPEPHRIAPCAPVQSHNEKMQLLAAPVPQLQYIIIIFVIQCSPPSDSRE